MNTRPLILIGDRRNRELRQRFEGVLKVWVRDWLGEDFHDYQVDSLTPIRSGLKKRQRIHRIVTSESGAWCALMWNPQIFDNLATLFWQDNNLRGRNQPGKGKVLRQVCFRALENMMEPLMAYPVSGRIIDEDKMVFPEDPLAEGKGAVSLSLRIKQIQIVFVLSAQSVQKWLEALPSVVSSKARPLQGAQGVIDDTRVAVQINFGGTELRMSDLASLEAGDVLRLDSKIEDPVSIQFQNTLLSLKGYLGKQSNKLAIRLVENEVE